MRYREFLLILCFILDPFTNVLADEIHESIHFSPSNLSFEKIDGYDVVRLKDCDVMNNINEPQLPVYIARIVLPQGSIVKEIRAKSLSYEDLPDRYYIYPAQPPQILSKKEADIVFVPPDDAVYNSANPYPSELIKFVDTGYLGGYQIAAFLVYPVQYIPKDRKLRIHTSIAFEVHFEQNKARYPLNVKCRSAKNQELYENLVKSLVLNPDDVELPLYKSVPTNGYEYVIITGDGFVDEFEPLAQWNTKRGIPAVIRTTSWIYSNFNGKDEPDQIRNFLKLAYRDSGLVWALLGGDVDVVPARIAFAMDCGYPGNDLPCDLYYSDLDGSWDVNENGVYGEVADEVDLYPDIFLGRASVNTISDANTFMNKILTYERDSPPDYLLRILFCAEMLWPNTDAGIGKNMIEEESVPSRFDITKLYQSLGNENTSTVLAAMSAGQHFINHDGHGSDGSMSVGQGSLKRSDADSLSNGPRNSILFSIGCWTCAFHYDCIAEHFINNPDGGCIAYIGNASYGWGSPGNPGYGYSDKFDSRFYHSLFLDNDYKIGKTLAEAKAHYVALSRTENVYRWHQYELTLLGDPTMDIWTDTPDSLNVVFPDSICGGMSLFMVKVQKQSGQPINNALVCIMKPAWSSDRGSEVYEYEHTDSQGEAKFTISASPGSLLVTVTAHNFYPYEGASKIFATGPYVSYYSHTVNDMVGGNGDGLVNPGEAIKLNILLKNFGDESADNVTAILRTNDTLVTITDSLENFGNIPAGDSAWSLEGFSFEVDRFCINGHVINFDLEIKSNTKDLWHSFFGITVATPILAYHSFSINDSTGNNDGIADPGETVDILVSVKNEGLCEAVEVVALLSTDDPYITINLDSVSCGNILRDSVYVVNFNATISPMCPSPYFAPLTLSIIASDGYAFMIKVISSFVLTIGKPGFSDNMEDGVAGWTHGGTEDSWELTQHMAHSFSHSWYCGNQSNWRYDNNMDCWLLSPKFVLGLDSYLSFWAWYDVTTYGVDGLYVQIGDGSHWDTLDFIGSGGALDSLYNVGNDWREYSYDLHSYSLGCTLQVRFNFVSDERDLAEGFYIDDVQVGPYTPGPSLHNLSFNIDDYIGDNDGRIDSGEEISMVVSIINDGFVNANDVIATLEADNPHVNVIVDSSYFGNITVKSISDNSTNPYILVVDSIVPRSREERLIRFILHITACSGRYKNVSAFTVKIESACPGVIIHELEILESEYFPNSISGLAFDGTYLCYCTPEYSSIYEANPIMGVVSTCFSTPEKKPGIVDIALHDTTWCDRYFWVHNRYIKRIYKIDNRGRIYTSFDSPADSCPAGITFDGENLWVADRDAQKIYKITTEGALLATYDEPVIVDRGPGGLAFEPRGPNGGSLIHAITFGQDSTVYYEIDRTDCQIVEDHYFSGPPKNGTAIEVDPTTGDYWVADSSRFIYKVKGFYSYVGIKEQPTEIPTILLLSQNYPNPMNNKTLIEYQLPFECHVRLSIYDLTGRLVRELTRGKQKTGNYRIRWDGIDSSGRNVPNGVYFYRIQAGTYVNTKKIILLR
jgi:hypothetical protein